MALANEDYCRDDNLDNEFDDVVRSLGDDDWQSQRKGLSDATFRAISGHLKAHRDEDSTPVQIGRYKVRRAVGSGGFGTVYECYDERLARIVAVKVAKYAFSARELENFAVEARALAVLEHPNITPVFDFAFDLCSFVNKNRRGALLVASNTLAEMVFVD